MKINGMNRLIANNYSRITVIEKDGAFTCKVAPKTTLYEERIITSDIEYELSSCQNDLEEVMAIINYFLRTHTICLIGEKVDVRRNKNFIVIKEINGTILELSCLNQSKNWNQKIMQLALDKYLQDRVKMIDQYMNDYPVEKIMIHSYERKKSSYQLLHYGEENPVFYLGFNLFNSKKSLFRQDAKFVFQFLKGLVMKHSHIQYDLEAQILVVDGITIHIYERTILEQIISFIKEEQEYTYQLKMEE